jgi:sugar/nucleoside kinase (ribokinase family)
VIARVPETPTGSAFVSDHDDGDRDFVYTIAPSAAPQFDAGRSRVIVV